MTDNLERPRPYCDWHEDRGNVLWWRIPISERAARLVRRDHNIEMEGIAKYMELAATVLDRQSDGKADRAAIGALDLVMRLHVEGTLSEGQVATALGLDRVEVRRLADEIKMCGLCGCAFCGCGRRHDP